MERPDETMTTNQNEKGKTMKTMTKHQRLSQQRKWIEQCAARGEYDGRRDIQLADMAELKRLEREASMTQAKTR
jgi:hypothetical protein